MKLFYELSGKQISDLRGGGGRAGRGEGLQGRQATSSSAGPGLGLGRLGDSSFFNDVVTRVQDPSSSINQQIFIVQLQLGSYSRVEQKMRANLVDSGAF